MSITHAEKRAWILKIKDVKESDKGYYMCQINTDPMKSQVVYLQVVGKYSCVYACEVNLAMSNRGNRRTISGIYTGLPPISWHSRNQAKFHTSFDIF